MITIFIEAVKIHKKLICYRLVILFLQKLSILNKFFYKVGYRL